jgi:hypothetical protein
VDLILLGAGAGAMDGPLPNMKFLVGRLGHSVGVSAIQPLPTQPDCLALSGWMGSSRNHAREGEIHCKTSSNFKMTPSPLPKDPLAESWSKEKPDWEWTCRASVLGSDEPRVGRGGLQVCQNVPIRQLHLVGIVGPAHVQLMSWFESGSPLLKISTV